MKQNPHLHIYRALGVIVIALIVGGVVRSFLVPASFGKYGPYRGDHIYELRLSSPVYHDDDYCLDCHEKEWDMADGKHATVPCETCHFLAGIHARGSGQEFVTKIHDFAEAQAKVVFQTLYTVMSKGWTQKKINELIKTLNHNRSYSLSVQIFRGPPVILEFGDRDEELPRRESDPDIAEALKGGKDVLTLSEKDRIRYLFPVIAEKKCLSCHTMAKSGDVNGVVEVSFPAEKAVERNTEGPSSIVSTMYKESERSSAFIYESVLSFFRKGWESGKVNELIQSYNSNSAQMSVRLTFLSELLEKGRTCIDPVIVEILRDGIEMQAPREKARLRYIYPIIADSGCVTCHRHEEGKVMAALDVSFPRVRIRMPRQIHIAEMPVNTSQESCKVCHHYSAARPKGFPQVKNFTEHIGKNWRGSMGERKLRSPCVTCHYAHMPRKKRGRA